MAIFFRPQGVRLRAFTATLFASAALMLASGCAQLAAPPYAADYEALDRLEAARPGMVERRYSRPIRTTASTR